MTQTANLVVSGLPALGDPRCTDQSASMPRVRGHLVVAFSDQMATPQTRYIGTLAEVKRAGKRFANKHLKRKDHTHRRLMILDEATGQQSVVALD